MPSLSMHAGQRRGSVWIRFSVPFLLSIRIICQATSPRSSSCIGKRTSWRGLFSLGKTFKSGGLRSGIYAGWRSSRRLIFREGRWSMYWLAGLLPVYHKQISYFLTHFTVLLKSEPTRLFEFFSFFHYQMIATCS